MVPNPIKMDDLGVPLFLETPIFVCHEARSSKLVSGEDRGGSRNLFGALW